MITGFRYSLREAFEGFRRATISSFISVFTLSFLLILMGFLSLISLNIDRLANALHANVEIQVFIANTLDDNEIARLRNEIQQVKGVEQIQFYSKEEAAKEFQKEFGEEIFNLLDENPLPSSFNIKLADNYRNAKAIKQVASVIESKSGVDEVVYHTQALKALNHYARMGKILNIIVLFFVTGGSLFIVANTIRLIIIAKKEIIETMKLVGATQSFIRRPFLIEGFIQGTIAGAITVLFIKVLVKIINFQLPGLLFVSTSYWLALLCVGVLFGFFGSAIAVKKFL